MPEDYQQEQMDGAATTSPDAIDAAAGGSGENGSDAIDTTMSGSDGNGSDVDMTDTVTPGAFGADTASADTTSSGALHSDTNDTDLNDTDDKSNGAPNASLTSNNLEDVFAKSGGGGDSGWNVEVRWEGHNSGSHSEVQVKARETAGKSGEYVHIHLTFNGHGEIASMGQGVNNCTSWTRNGNEIDIYRQGHYNQGENFSFMISDIRFTDSQYEGGIGSYYPSETNTHQTAPEFTATIDYC